MKYLKTKRLVSAALVAAMAITLPSFGGSNLWSTIAGRTEVYATSSEIKRRAEEAKKKAEEEKKKAEEAKKKAEEEKKKAQQDKNDAANRVDRLEDKVDNIQIEISYATKKLKAAAEEQEKINAEVSDKQAEIVQCTKDLGEAKDAVDAEYVSMKRRIQFMYENSSSDSVWMAILGADGISDMLNRIEYVADVYSADRDLMTDYQAKVDTVEELSVKLNDDLATLVELQEKNEAKKEELDGLVSDLKALSETYKKQLKNAQYSEAAAANAAANADKAANDAQKAADNAQKTINEQARIIRQQEALAANVNSNNYDGGGTGSGGINSNVAYLNDPSYDPAAGVSGADIVAFAKQFVGGKYVWGGNSLTNGVDCSGFVNQVYKHFGIATPRYSQAFKTWGKPVAFANIQPGDVVVYPGHVAIYAGGGLIVEAQSTKAGITCSRSVKCHTISAIRRYSK